MLLLCIFVCVDDDVMYYALFYALFQYSLTKCVSLTGLPSGPSTLGLFANGEIDALLLRWGGDRGLFEFSFPVSLLISPFTATG